MAFETRVHQEFQVRPPPQPQIETSKYLYPRARATGVTRFRPARDGFCLRSTFFGVCDASDLVSAHFESASSAALASRGVSGDALSVHALRGVRFGR